MFKKRPAIVAFWLNDRHVPFIPIKMSLAEIVGTMALLGGVGLYLAILIGSAIG